MKKISAVILLLIYFLLTSNSIAQNGWQTRTVSTTKNLHQIFFLNSLSGWIVGDSGIVFKTSNGGNNWIKSVYQVQSSIYSIFFVNELTGWAGGQNITTGAGFIINTTNGGISWSESQSDSPHEIYFANVSTGWACGYSNGTMMKCCWTSQPLISGQLYSLSFPNALTGWVGGGITGSTGVIYKTTNSGSNWNLQWNASNNYIAALRFTDTSNGYAAGLNGYIIRTTNGGTNWSTQNSGTTSLLKSICFPNSTTGYIVGYNGTILKTLNKGFNWNLQTTPLLNANYLWVFFNSVDIGWAVGEHGALIKTTSGGTSSIINYNNNIPNSFLLYQNYPNPFNSNSRIKIDNEKSRNLKLTVYDVNGREVCILINERLQPGTYDVDFNGEGLPSGMYFYKLTTDVYSVTKKMALLK